MNPHLVSAQVLPNFCLLPGFDIGETRLLDVGSSDIPALLRLANPVYFTRAHVAQGTIAGSDDKDICPDTLDQASQPTEQKAA